MITIQRIVIKNTKQKRVASQIIAIFFKTGTDKRIFIFVQKANKLLSVNLQTMSKQILYCHLPVLKGFSLSTEPNSVSFL